LIHNSKIRWRIHRLSALLTGSRWRIFLFLNRELYAAFLCAPVNALLLLLTAGMTLLRVHRGGGVLSGGCVPLQLILWPFLMALEEFQHVLVFLQMKKPDSEIDLVTVHRIGRKGRSMVCYGGAVRHLDPVDRIRISSPGPAMGLFGILLLWSIISLASGSLYAAGAHLTALPTLLYLLSGLWPFQAPFPTDMSNILRAKVEGRMSWRQVLSVGLGGLGMIFNAVGKEEAGGGRQEAVSSRQLKRKWQ